MKAKKSQPDQTTDTKSYTESKLDSYLSEDIHSKLSNKNPPLSAEQKSEPPKDIESAGAKVAEYVYRSYAGNKTSIEIYSGDAMRLQPERELNDKIVNFYLKYLEQECMAESLKSRVHIFNSYFYLKLKQMENAANSNMLKLYCNLKNWTKGVDLFSKDYILIPVCDKEHWWLAVVCHPSAVFENAINWYKSPSGYAPQKTSNLIILTSTEISCKTAGRIIKTYINLEYCSRKMDTETKEILKNYDGYGNHFKTWEPNVMSSPIVGA
eukprot:TRINITY_DN17090_c0_g1_i7.p1 TRINITY_DN17090_c0_g1~~TRINITY_DN17090_c0_g1_i7.p1  ORF type:complete len:267 (+),score=59.06 TRINITY_DN17090_c0_g1_i7:286-1086(+)